MAVKKSLHLSDRHHRFVQRKVAEGAYDSPNELVAAGIERLIEEETAQEAALQAMAGEIRRRQATPVEAFVDLDDDDLFERLRQNLQQR